MGEVLQAFSTTDLKSVCTKGQDGVALDPWAHCHGLGALLPTLEPTSYLKFDMCCSYNRLLEPTSTVRCKRQCILGLAAQRPGVATDLLAAYKYTLPLYTINIGCGAWWRSAPFISKLSKLLQAL